MIDVFIRVKTTFLTDWFVDAIITLRGGRELGHTNFFNFGPVFGLALLFYAACFRSSSTFSRSIVFDKLFTLRS
jgi:hypothetical protein